MTFPGFQGYPRARQVDEHLANPFPAGMPAKAAGASSLLIPFLEVSSFSGHTQSATRQNLCPLLIWKPIIVTDIGFKVASAAGATTATTVALYRCDDYFRPDGHPIICEEISVGSGASGYFSAPVGSVPVAPGAYLTFMWSDQNLSFTAARPGLMHDQADNFANGYYATVTYAAGNPGPLDLSTFTTFGSGTPAPQCVLFRWIPG